MWVDDGKPSGKRVRFYLRAKQDAEETQKEGRPIFKMVEYVTIEIPADKTMSVDRPVRDMDKQEFAKQYEAFKADKDQDTAGGTLLSATGLLPPERIEELAHFRIRTVEQLASVSDSNIGQLGLHSRAERQRCRDFLEAAKSNAPLLRLEAQLETERNNTATMQQQLRDLQATVESLRRKPQRDEGEDAPEEAAPAAPRRRGRPPKASHMEGA